MICIENYHLISDKSRSWYYVKSLENSICPICSSSKLASIGSRQRKVLDGNGETLLLVIRRLRCRNCNRIHHELPDLIVPYKRYSSEEIETIIESEPGNSACETCCENSSIYRLRRWFQSISGHMAGCLGAIAAQRGLPIIAKYRSSLQNIKAYTGDAPGWLARTVRTLSNTNNWIHTRSAFLS